MITSSYPRHPRDYAGAFVERSLDYYADSGPVTVVCPDDRHARFRGTDAERFRVVRSGALFRKLPGPFYGSGAPVNLKNPFKLALIPYAVGALAHEAWGKAVDASRVVSHWIVPAGLIGAAVRERYGLPHQLIVHGSDWMTLRRAPGGMVLARWIFERSDDIVAVSPQIAQEIRAVTRRQSGDAFVRRLRVVPMGIDTEPYRRLAALDAPDDELRVAFLGRLIRGKGVRHLVRAISGIEGLRLEIGGEGYLRHEIERLARSLRVSLRMLGEVDGERKLQLFGRSQVMAICSHSRLDFREGCPQVLLEAMASGRAVLATASGGIPSVIEHERNGLLVPPGDEGALRRALLHLRNDADLRRRLGKAAAIDAENYDWKRIGPRLAEGFAEL